MWCDGRSDAKTTKHKKCDSVLTSTTQKEKEEQVESIYQSLKENHERELDNPRFCLWARMIASGLHEDYEIPSDIPAFSGNVCKKPKKDNIYDALTSAAVAFTKAVNVEKPVSSPSTLTTTNISPMMCVELRMKHFEQLRYLQQLLEDGILNENEYTEQKENIINK